MPSGQIVNPERREEQPFESDRLIVLLETTQSLVRELSIVIERALALCDGGAVSRAARPIPPLSRPVVRPGASLSDLLESYEKEALERALESAAGNRARAARLLGTTERIFNYRVRKYGIDWRQYRR